MPPAAPPERKPEQAPKPDPKAVKKRKSEALLRRKLIGRLSPGGSTTTITK